MRRVFILLRKFNGGGAEVFAESIAVKNTGKRKKRNTKKCESGFSNQCRNLGHWK